MIYVAQTLPDWSQELGELCRRLEGAEVKVFGDGLALYEEIHDHPPRVIIIDLLLPGLDAVMMTRLLKFDSRFADLSVLVLAGQREPGLEDRLRSAGADAVFFLPLETGTLLEDVSKRLQATNLSGV